MFSIKKNSLSLLFAIVSVIFTHGQSLSIKEARTYDDVWNAEREVDFRLLYLFRSSCDPCEAMEKNVFTNERIQEKLNERIGVYKVDIGSAYGQSLVDSFAISILPTYLFFHPNGELMHRVAGFSSVQLFYREISFAQNQLKNWISFDELNQKYRSQEAQQEDLYQLLNRTYPLTGSQPLILEKYLNSLPESEQYLEKNLILIAQHIESVNSKAFEILKNALDSFFRFTEVQQKAVLNAISKAKYGTFTRAVGLKDDFMLEQLISSVHETAYSAETAMQEERQFRYDFAKLTENFKHFAVIAYREAPFIIEATNQDATKNEAGAAQLHEFAYGFLQMTKQESELKSAVKWVAKAVSLDEKAQYWHTYAKLLSRIGRKKDARKAIKRAKKIVKQRGGDTKKWDFSI